MCEGTVRIILKGAIILVHSCCSHGAGVCPHTHMRPCVHEQLKYGKKKIIFWKRIFIIKSGWLINFSYYEFFSDFLSWDAHGLLSLVFSARLIPHVIIEYTSWIIEEKVSK